MEKEDNREMAIDKSNWLDSKTIECAACGQKLHWLWHSPMYDCTFYYCTLCPKRVEVSHYDKTYGNLHETARKEMKEDDAEAFSKRFIALVEEHLAPCDCGGRFEYASLRRCLKCYSPLPESEVNRDVWPPETGREPELDYQSLNNAVELLIKRKNIWKA